MRIAVIEPSGGLYGSEFALLDLVEEIGGVHEWDLYLPKKAALLDRLKALPVSPVPVLAESGDKSRFARWFSYLRLGMKWCRDRPDLVYVNQAGVIRPISFLCGILKIPIVCQVQTLEDARWVNRKVRRSPAIRSFLCNSRFIARSLLVDEDRKSIFYQGYHWKNLRPPSRPEEDPYRIGLLGRIGESKGHFLLVEAARILRDQKPGEPWKFVLIGSAKTKEEEQRLKDSIREVGLEDDFEFRGYCPDIAAELARIHLLVIPSIAEPLGRILFEAAEAGLPMVCSDAGGLGEVSRHFDIGLRFESGNAHALANALQAGRSRDRDWQREEAERGMQMLQCLDLPDYASTVNSLLLAAASGEKQAIHWFGKSPTPPASFQARQGKEPSLRISFFSNLPYTRNGGGSYVVSASLFDQLSYRYHQSRYHWIQLPLLRWKGLQAKWQRRIRKQPSQVTQYSSSVLARVAAQVEEKLENEEGVAFFKGVTPWTMWTPDRPYFIYTDVAFATLLRIQDRRPLFQSGDVERVVGCEREFLGGASAVFFESEWGRRQAIEDYELTGDNFHAPGRAGLFPPQPRDRWTGKPPALVSIAKHFHLKGGGILFQSFETLRAEFPDLVWHIIGGPPPRHVERTEGVIYEGFLEPEDHSSRERFTSILRSASLLVHPTLEDTNPLVITEAASFGCPSVSVDRFAIPELIDHGISGFLLPFPAHEEDLTDAIRNLLTAGDGYNRMREAAKAKAEANGTWKDVTDRIASVIETSGMIKGDSGNQDLPHHA